MSPSPPLSTRDLRLAEPRADFGFTVVELLVAMFVMTEVMLLVLVLFDVNNRITRVETQTADMQQAQRIGQHDIVRTVRMAGRGGLRTSQAIELATQVDSDATIADTDSPDVVEGTDVLTVRGVFSSPVYMVNFQDSTTLLFDSTSKTGTITVNELTTTGIVQPLDYLDDMDESGSVRPEALILVSSVSKDIFAVVKVLGVSVDSANGKATVTFSTDADDSVNAAYLNLSCCQNGGAPEFPGELEKAAFVGVLEEYRYYIRDGFAVEGDDQSGQVPRLSRARVYPNTDNPWDGDSDSLQLDIADDVQDLQIALAIDADGDGSIDSTSSPDEWLHNVASETRTGGFATGPIHFMRITTVARSARQDPTYTAPPIEGTIEDRAYNENELAGSEDERLRRTHRRRVLRSTIDLRNL